MSDIQWLDVSKIRTEKLFSDLFPIKEEVYSAIKNHMQNEGYDESQPVVIWKERGVIVDGHTRFKAAFMITLKQIPVIERSFDSEYEALKYAIHNQRDRRNMTDDDILRCVAVVDERRKAGNTKSSKNNRGQFIQLNKLDISEPTHVTTARTVGVSPSKVQRARKVIEEATPEEKIQIKSGERKIHSVYKDIKQREKEAPKPSEKPVFNETNDNIKWAKWSWNPVTGCKHGCAYCYARDIANRFYPEKFEPTFRPERLSAPINTKIPKNRENEPGINKVFLVSMGDLYGEWVPDEWIDKVMQAVNSSSSKWTYLVLTKNPRRYLKGSTIGKMKNVFPGNLWMGATADTQARADVALDVFGELKSGGINNTMFLSCEPLTEAITLKNDSYDWLIIGGQTASSQASARQPQPEWSLSLTCQAFQHGKPVYWKENLERPQQYPNDI